MTPLSVNPLLNHHSPKNKTPKSLYFPEVLVKWSLMRNKTENNPTVPCPVDQTQPAAAQIFCLEMKNSGALIADLFGKTFKRKDWVGIACYFGLPLCLHVSFAISSESRPPFAPTLTQSHLISNTVHVESSPQQAHRPQFSESLSGQYVLYLCSLINA